MPDPGSDRPLDTSTVAMLLAEQYPDVEADRIRFLASGWDNDVFRTPDGWLFRFPRRTEVVPWVEREAAIMPLIADALVDFTVPRFEIVGRPSVRFPYPFVGYREVPGVIADELEEPPSALAADIGRALGRLHDIDPGLIPPHPAGSEGEEGDPWWAGREAVERADEIRARLPSGVLLAVEPFLRGEVTPPAPSPLRRVVHNDFAPEHILVDRATGRLSGIIDFADLVVGDPVDDLVGLVGWGGYGFVADVLDVYPLPLDPGARDRLRFGARVLNLIWLADSEDEEDVIKHRRWTARAFADAFPA